jgi:hypothetical protein
MRTSTARLPAKIQPIDDWAEPRSVENVQQFSSFGNLYREVAGTVAVNYGLGCAEKRRERSAVLELWEPLPRGRRYSCSQLRIGLRREASRTFCSSWASQIGKAADGADGVVLGGSRQKRVGNVKTPFYRGANSGAFPPRKADGGRDRRKRFRAWRGSIAIPGDQKAPSGGISLEEIQASRDQPRCPR